MSSFLNRKVKLYYDQKALTYDEYSDQFYFKVYDAVTWRIIEPYIPRDSTAKVLDAAGGTGRWSIPIAKCGPKVVLADISEGMLKVAKTKIAQEGLNEQIEIKECDLHKLDFEDDTFDLVFCDHALCFIKEQVTVVKELCRVLKKGHPLVMSVQNRYVLSLSLISEDVNLAFRVLSGELPFTMHGKLEVYALSPEEFRRMLESNGIRLERMIGKVFTMPLALSWKKLSSTDYTKELLDKIISIEFELASRLDTIPMGGHIQAIGLKQN